jgi:cellulose synthase/poly-beta-1,6-N-acetylglucosamine synthase-like glycosyltransferase
MAPVPGLLTVPTVLLNFILGLQPDRTLPVLGTDTLAVVVPMYNEEYGARRCLASILRQERQADQIIITVNGGTDNTYGVADRILREYGYRPAAVDEVGKAEARLEHWLNGSGSRVVLLDLRNRTAKSESVNLLFQLRLISTDRLLLVDGDTMLHPRFIQALHRNFYRARRRMLNGHREWVIEDYALQSGTVSSWLPAGAGPVQRLISAGRQGEYAFSTVLRRGQSFMSGRSRTFGSSRLFTATGCGFAARSELFPMPADTRTEDHEFTLACQALPAVERLTSIEALGRLGFRIEAKGRELPAAEFFVPGERIVFRSGGNARYVPEAFMLTEDPLNLGGLLAQVERWNGGGQEGALKRLGRKLPGNVAFTVWSAQAENLLGAAVMLVVLPLLLALHLGNPSLGMSPAALAPWFLADCLLTLTVNTAGFTLQRRARGLKLQRALLTGLRSALLTLLPYLLLRYLNPFTWLASATVVVPAWLRGRKQRSVVTGVSWDRVRLGSHRSRTQGLLLSLTLAYPLLVSWGIAPRVSPVNVQAWQLVQQQIPPGLADHAFGSPLFRSPGELQPFCEPPGGVVPAAQPAVAVHHEPLGAGDLLTLARLAPLLPLIEKAAAAYDVSAHLLIRVLLNESYLDPLAEGPTADIGLSQVTADALTLLAAISLDQRSRWYNPALITQFSNAYDPEFSACAGAAKLAWALDQPGVTDEREAYALYINPLHGFTNGAIGDRWLPLTATLGQSSAAVDRLLSVQARYLEDPLSVTPVERQLLQVTEGVRAGQLTLEEAYRNTLAVVLEAGIDDAGMYRRVLARLYGGIMAGTGAGAD